MGASQRVKSLLQDWCISVLFQHVCHGVPGATEHKATVPVKVGGVKPSLNILLYHTVYIPCCIIQDGNAAEIRFNGSASLSNVDFAALKRHTVYTSDFYAQLVIYRS